tara:strand:- start:1958 stop:4006 length:2049 start_codon:yes stop_codon:yes gene_type:complete
MADVITSIGSDSSITTGTPSSCSGSSSPYSVTFPSAPSGVSIGDSVSFQDEVTTFATYTYLVTGISSSTLTLKFVSESSGYGSEESPCSILNSSYSQATGTFKRTYSTITSWESDLDNTAIYSSGDDAIGECYKDSNFNEAFTINGGGTVGLDSVKLTAPAGQRHDGTAGSGVVNVYNSGTQSTSVISRQNTTISFMEYHMGSNSVNNRAVTVSTSAYTDIIFSQNIIHNLTGSFPIAIFFDDGNSASDTRYCHNNLIYDIDDNDDRVKAVLISGSYPLKVWNNTTYLIRTGSGSKNAYSFACDTASTAMEVKNCLAIMTSSVGTEGFALNYTSDSDYNGSDFSTATGNSNDLTSLTTAVFEDYDGTPPEFALADDSSPIGAGVDLGTTGGVNIDITGRDRSSDSSWSMGAFQFVNPNITVSADPLIGVGILGTPAVSKSTTISASALTSVGVLIGTSAESITISATAMTSLGTLLGTSSEATTISASPMVSIGVLSGSSAEAITITASPLTSVAVLGGSTTETITISASPMTSIGLLTGTKSSSTTISASPMISIAVLGGSTTETITISADAITSVGTMTGSRIANVTVTASPMVSESKLLGTAVERITIASSALTSVATLEGALIGDVTVNASPMISKSLLLGNRVTGYEVLYITDARLNRSATNCSISVSKITDVILKE